MNEGGAYGDSIARRFRMDRAHSSQIIRVSSDVSFAITRLGSGATGFARTLPIPPERALIVVLQLQPLLKHKLWFGTRAIPVGPWGTGAVSVVDLEENPSAYVCGPSDVLQFYLPRSSLDLMAAYDDGHAIRKLDIPDGSIDVTIHRLGLLALPAIQNPDHANLLFLSGLMTALYAHLGQTYGEIGTKRPAEHARLTNEQLARAKDIIYANVRGNVSISAIASECQLPASCFTYAFTKATGMAPHRWLLAQRVDSAKELLLMGNLNCDEIAAKCGFFDRNHLVRVFLAMVGATPAQWQRHHGRLSRK